MSDNCDDLNKLEYTILLYESIQLATKLVNHIEDGWMGGMREYKARHICVKAWQRHWRRVVKYNTLFDANLCIPDWYLAGK